MPTLPPGTRVGPYEVVGTLGAGGMGEVFRARDLTLERDVALKVLPPAHAADENRRSRFAREARLLAALSHPHVAQVYGVEDSVAGPAIAMELVEGRTLADLIRTGDLPRRHVPELARQIAAALDAAHEKGFLHRDLKPANVIVTPDGTAKLLDFGLAKAFVDDGDGALGHAPTLTGTAYGEIVGTPAYMSPEQARGQAVDRRTDVWAFGCVLYELLAGAPAFRGATSSDTLAAVLEREPDWSALPSDTPPALRMLIARCLEKDTRRRLRDIGDALNELSAPTMPAVSTGAHPIAALPAGSAAPRHLRRTMAIAAAALVVGALATWLAMAAWTSSEDVAPATAVRFALPPPAGASFGGLLPNLEATTLAFSPDGTRLAFVAMRPSEPPRVWIRVLHDETATEVRGTDRAISVFWSPDGRSVAFFADGQLRRVDLDGSAAVKICDVAVNVGLSGAWGQGGDILFNSIQADAIYRVPAAGGTPVPLIVPQADSGIARVAWPRYLPGGQILYTSLEADSKGRIWLAQADGSSTPILEATSHVQWVDPHWILFVREGTLLAQRVDLGASRPVGDPVSIVGGVRYSAATGWADFTASWTGRIAAQTHHDENRVAWIDSSGHELAQVGAPGGYFTLSLSPDDRTLMFTRLRRDVGNYDIWTTDLTRSAETPMTSGPGMKTGEVWLPDGRGMAFSAAQGTVPNLHYKDFTTGTERRLLSSPRFQFPTDASRDSGTVFYQQRTDLGDWDVLSVSLADPSRVTPVLASPFSEHSFKVSPAGTHAAFVSDESGRSQVYVMPLPPTGQKTMVSTSGGARPKWRKGGRELYFLSGGRLMVVAIDAAGAAGTARPVFDARDWLDFDVTRDGRFIANVAVVVARQQPLSVIVNWTGPDGR